MPSAYIEPRPHSSNPHEPITHYVIVVEGQSYGGFSTQKEAKEAACAKGFRPVRVARVRHLTDKKNPDHWRKDPC